MQDRISLIFGKTGSGKSTLAKQLIRDENRLIIIDAMGEYNEPNIIIVESLLDCFEYIKQNETFKIACRFDNETDIEYLFQLVFEIKNICLLVEEAEIYISPYAKQSNFLRLVRYGRHRKIKIIGIARRCAELSIDLRANTNTIYCYRQSEPNDIILMKKLGFKNIENLPQFEYNQNNLSNLERFYEKIIL